MESEADEFLKLVDSTPLGLMRYVPLLSQYKDEKKTYTEAIDENNYTKVLLALGNVAWKRADYKTLELIELRKQYEESNKFIENSKIQQKEKDAFYEEQAKREQAKAKSLAKSLELLRNGKQKPLTDDL